jgi:branched-chain amino acid transport system ATP-binding protein
MDFIMGICDEVYVLDSGRLLFRGNSEDVAASALVREAYLGGEAGAADQYQD